ncbi:MAG: Spy/CpxP family protein refolding chaperone [candidate division KSB1 bacterium]|nr:Spy/CpxP family protein refolding chaperone [candidate division KSB1 bacterium]
MRLARFALAAALVAGICAASLAQGQQQQAEKKVQLNERARQMVERRLQRMDEVLNLTPEQEKKIREILEQEAAQFSGMDRERFRDMSPEERQQAMEQFRARREKTDKEIEKVLTPEQVEKYRKMQEEFRQRRGRRPGAPSQR